MAAIILAVLGFLFRDKLFVPTAAHAPVSVLVADFQNKTSDTLFDGTLEQGFNVVLEGASFISAYSRGDAHKTAAELKPGTHEMDESLARLVAQREGVSVKEREISVRDRSKRVNSNSKVKAISNRKINTTSCVRDPKPLKIKYIDLSQLRPDLSNPRLHNGKQIQQIANSIRAFGFM